MFKIRFPVRKIVIFNLIGIALSASLRAQNVNHGIAAALVSVVQNDESNSTNSVTATTTLSINQLALRPGSNRGDYNVQIGDGFSDDADAGILMTCVAENGRNNGETSHPGDNFCTTALDYSHSGGSAGGYFIPVFNAPAGAEFNINIAAAYFPYTNWTAGLAQNSMATNGGPNDLLIGSPGLNLGTHYVDNGGGVSTIDLTSLGINSVTDGVLLVTHGSNEDNYALSKVNPDGTWTVYVKDNAADADNYEQDPVAFVFIPKTNTAVVSGRFRSDGAPLVYSGATPQFNVTNLSTGVWRLTIPGYSPASGVLIISAEGGFSQNQDNIVSYEPGGDGWIIQSRDVPGNGLQTPSSGFQPVASFVFIPAATTTTLVAPLNNSQNETKSPDLQVSVSNAAPGNLTVKFYGRLAPPNPAEDFMMVALPDTQTYVARLNGGLPEMFFSQTEWIVTNRVSRNIAYVAHLGDISQSGDIKGSGNNATEWRHATNAMYRLENPARTFLQYGIPYGLAVGNHDLEPIGDPTGTSIYYNQYFGISHFSGKPYYAGHYGTNNNNHFDFFSAGGMDFVVLYFEYDVNANPTVLAWGNQVLKTNQHRRAIVVTHNFGNTQTPVNFSAQGAKIYNALKGNTNLFMMLSGHITGAGSRVDTFNGNTVRTFVSDYQGWENGGDGFMRLMTFSPSNNQVVIQTYSPYINEYRTASNHELFFDYNMDPPNVSPFALIGTSSNVSPGNIANMVWSNRQTNATYEWYVVVTDAANNTTTGPVWRFTTRTNSPPKGNNQFKSVTGDAPTNLTLSAFDEDGDALTFQTTSVPAHGIIKNFDAQTGVLTYVPAHGFRGFDPLTYRASDGFALTPEITINLLVTSPADTNSNNIPDHWETTYGITDPNADDDGDQQTNLEEYFANTNPTNAASVLHISDAARDESGHVTLVWPSVGGTRYRVQYSNGGTNASFTGDFIDIVRTVNDEMDLAPSDAPSTQTFIDDFTLTENPGTNQARYYRIKTVQ